MQRYMRRSFSRKEKLKLAAVLTAAALVFLCVYALAELKPILSNLATARVSNTVTKIVNKSVTDTIYSGGVDYDTLISFEKDANGEITAVKSNMAEFNRLQSQILDDVLTKLSETSTKELSIPIGTLSGVALLSGRGPAIKIRMQSVGSSSAHFENAFSSAGINQTKHQIMLVVDVHVSILLPGFTTLTKVSNTFSVAETVIVGSVPETYTHFSSSDTIDDLAGEYIMNNG